MSFSLSRNALNEDIDCSLRFFFATGDWTEERWLRTIGESSVAKKSCFLQGAFARASGSEFLRYRLSEMSISRYAVKPEKILCERKNIEAAQRTDASKPSP